MITNAMQVGMEIGSKGAMALTGQTTMLGKEALTGKLTMLYFHTLLFSLSVSEDPAQDALQISLQHHVNLVLCIVQHAGLVIWQRLLPLCHCHLVSPHVSAWSLEHEAAPCQVKGRRLLT